MSIFVKFEPISSDKGSIVIQGECQFKGFINYSEVESFEIGAEKTTEGTVGQSRRRGDVKLGDVTITKILDSTAPIMFKAMAMSGIFPRVTVSFTQSFAEKVDTKLSPTGSRRVLMEVIMEDVIASNYSISASGDDPPTETVILTYSRIVFIYHKYSSSGSEYDSALVGGWDAELCREISGVSSK